jgi:hypothetical protein
MNALRLADLGSERRELEAELAACREACTDAANRLDRVYEGISKTNAAPAIADEVYRIKTKLRFRRTPK